MYILRLFYMDQKLIFFSVNFYLNYRFQFLYLILCYHFNHSNSLVY